MATSTSGSATRKSIIVTAAPPASSNNADVSAGGGRNLRPRVAVALPYTSSTGPTTTRRAVTATTATTRATKPPQQLLATGSEVPLSVAKGSSRAIIAVPSSAPKRTTTTRAKPKVEPLPAVPEEPLTKRRLKKQDQPQPIKREAISATTKTKPISGKISKNMLKLPQTSEVSRIVKVEASGCAGQPIDLESDNEDEELMLVMKESAAMSQASSSNGLRSTLPPPPVTPYGPGTKNSNRSSLEVMTQQLQIMLTFEATTCSFCTVDLNVGEGIVLQDCYHAFCRDCVTTAIETTDNAEIMCPLHEECNGHIYECEIKQLLSPVKFEKYLNRSVIQAMGSMQNIFQCKFPNCDGVCMYETGNKNFLCPVCNNINCIQCEAIHDGLECKQYQDLVKTASNLEEAQALVANKAANGWEQMVGTVAGWVSNPSRKRGANRKSLAGSGNVLSKVFEQMAALDVIPNTQNFECSICFDDIAPGYGVIFQECFHMCCKDCCVALIENSDEPNVKCPYQDGNYSCVYYLQPREIRALVTPELYEKHLERSMKLAESAMGNSFHCKTTDCPGWCEYEEGAQVFKCPFCKKRNCLACQAIHEGVCCDDYKNNLVQGENDRLSTAALEELLKKGGAMRCPQCKAIVEKTMGCDWIVCSCKTELCWATKGPRWGPAGKGDTSGGCKCRVNNKLCVPNCQNCH